MNIYKKLTKSASALQTLRSYPLDGDGFFAICDCMFLCRWHGCDENGTEFSSEFGHLNENGLFNSKEEAIQYLYHYLSQEWAEIGEFCIVEIYR